MSAVGHSAQSEERADLEALRREADQTRQEAARIIAALASKVTSRDPRELARRAALIGGPAVLVTAAAVALIVYRRHKA